MKKLVNLFFIFAMMFSIVFLSEAISSNNPFSVKAQQVSVKKKRRGVIRRSYRGGRWVVRKTYRGGKWVTRKVWVASKWTGKKTWKNGRKVVSRTKKVVY